MKHKMQSSRERIRCFKAWLEKINSPILRSKEQLKIAYRRLLTSNI